MINKIFNKIKRTRRLLNEGVMPEKVFDLHYENGKIQKSDFYQPVITEEAANEWLKKQVLSSQPFFATRFGNAELGLVCNHLQNKLLNRDLWSSYSKRIVARDSAWHGDIQKQNSFYDIFLRSVSTIDAIGVWYNHGEQIMANYICPNSILFDLSSYEPFFHRDPWTLALEGKKVLVIHPYERSITDQYKKRELLFNYPVLPAFELSCYVPFSTYNDEWTKFSTSEKALENMIIEVLGLDFDIALIASGQFGLPLGAAIKRSGKQAVHIGGALQLFFGIIGRRWESPLMPHSNFFNENWKRPYLDEIPTDPNVLKFSDNGCYW
jgi:hypothetical protein